MYIDREFPAPITLIQLIQETSILDSELECQTTHGMTNTRGKVKDLLGEVVMIAVEVCIRRKEKMGTAPFRYYFICSWFFLEMVSSVCADLLNCGYLDAIID